MKTAEEIQREAEAEIARAASAAQVNEHLATLMARVAPPEGTTADRYVEWISTEMERLQKAVTELTELRPLADMGRQYQADLVQEALAEGARAFGAEFARGVYEQLLNTSPIEVVKRMRDDWRAVGDKQFPGGRVSEDSGSTAEAPGAGQMRRPDKAYVS